MQPHHVCRLKVLQVIVRLRADASAGGLMRRRARTLRTPRPRMPARTHSCVVPELRGGHWRDERRVAPGDAHTSRWARAPHVSAQQARRTRARTHASASTAHHPNTPARARCRQMTPAAHCTSPNKHTRSVIGGPWHSSPQPHTATHLTRISAISGGVQSRMSDDTTVTVSPHPSISFMFRSLRAHSPCASQRGGRAARKNHARNNSVGVLLHRIHFYGPVRRRCRAERSANERTSPRADLPPSPPPTHTHT